jgi:hypothetical protein
MTLKKMTEASTDSRINVMLPGKKPTTISNPCHSRPAGSEIMIASYSQS